MGRRRVQRPGDGGASVRREPRTPVRCGYCGGPTLEDHFFFPAHPHLTLSAARCRRCRKYLVVDEVLAEFIARLRRAREAAEQAPTVAPGWPTYGEDGPTAR
jgi:hypothetical protein